MRRTPKTPQQKKPEPSPRKKATVHRAERRIAHQALAATVAHEDLELPDAVEPRLKRKRLQGLRKLLSTALGTLVERKRQRRAVLVGRKKKARAAR